MASLLFLPLLVILYFMMIRPQQRRVRAQQALIAALEVGDEVLTTAGMFGTITALDGDVVTLQIAEGVEVRMARAAIGRMADEVLGTSPAAGLGGPADVDLRADERASDADPADPADPSSTDGPVVGGAA
ncbi:MAG: preprotein translocase subunit YajC [Acidimicrobiales bacterium]|nr:preprotein translocase subunit YajC [Acidimicrobiales bacterium]